MKKTLFTIGMFAILATSAIMFSAFTSPKHETKTEFSQNEMNDPWKKVREGVAICDGENACIGTGDIYVNEETGQGRITIINIIGCSNCKSDKYDLTAYSGKDGYNFRFWCSRISKYCYVMVS